MRESTTDCIIRHDRSRRQGVFQSSPPSPFHSLFWFPRQILSTTANALHQQVFLFKIANTLSTLSTLPSLTLPSPTPAPEHLLQNAPTIRTRSTRTSFHAKETGKETDWPEVVRTSQLIPVVSVLVDHASQGKAVRDALEEGVKDAKELTRESLEMKRAWDRAERERKEKAKVEKEQMAKDTKAQAQDKKGKGKGGASAKGKEKEKEKGGTNVQEKEKDAKGLEDTPTHTLTPQTALTIALSSCAQRIIPLGRDSEGRVYWALTPGRGERDFSREYLTSNIEVGERDEGAKTKSRKPKSRSTWTSPSLSERASHKRWSWFIAVWGVRPTIEERTDPPLDEDCSESDSEPESDHDSESDEDDDKSKKSQKTKTECPRWYAFSEPAEIFKLAEWVERKAGLAPRSSSSKKSKPRPVPALPRAASASTSHAVSSSNTHTSVSTSTVTSSFDSSSNKLSKASKFVASLLADEVSSSEIDESESSDKDQSEDDDMDVDSPIDFDDTPRTPQLQSLVRELRAYAVLLKNRA
jgi:hypothetical protein